MSVLPPRTGAGSPIAPKEANMSNLAHVAQQHGALQFAPWLSSEPSICDTTSPEALETGRPHVFGSVECCRRGRWS